VTAVNQDLRRPDDGRPRTVRIPDDLWERVSRKAARDDRSIASAVRHALRLYVEGVTGG
jgi:hypothetical protein